MESTHHYKFPKESDGASRLFLFRSLLGCYADSTADRGGIDLAAAGTLYTFAYRSGMRTLGALK